MCSPDASSTSLALCNDAARDQVMRLGLQPHLLLPQCNATTLRPTSLTHFVNATILRPTSLAHLVDATTLKPTSSARLDDPNVTSCPSDCVLAISLLLQKTPENRSPTYVACKPSQIKRLLEHEPTTTTHRSTPFLSSGGSAQGVALSTTKESHWWSHGCGERTACRTRCGLTLRTSTSASTHCYGMQRRRQVTKQ